MKTNWDKRFMDLAIHVSKWSKDRSIGVGAVITTEDHRIVSIGYNGFPSGCDDDMETRHERPQKYLFTEHAERNAIYNTTRLGVSTVGCTMYLPWFPCADCARAIIQSGIKKLVYGSEPTFDDAKWGDHFKVAYEMLTECKIQLVHESH